MKKAMMIVLLVLTQFSVSPASQTVTIFYQNDLHGWFFPSTQEAGLPKVLEALKAEQAKASFNLYVVAGDILTGPSLPEPEKGRIELKVWDLFQRELDVLGLKDRHLLTLGNHEFDYGFLHELKELKPVVANIVDKDSVPFFQPFRIVKDENVSIAFLGLIMTDNEKVNTVLNQKGLKTEGHLQTIKKYQQEICRADLTALVIHDSIPNIKNLIENLPKDNCIDLVISGHSHIKTETPIYIAGKPVLQAGSMNQYLGKALVKIERKRAEIIQNSLIPLYPDKFTFALMMMKEIVSEQKGKTIAMLKESLLKPKGKVPNQSTLGSFVADAIRWKAKTDISIVNNDSFRKEIHVYHEPIPIREGDIKEIYPYRNKIVTGTVKGFEIIKFVESEIEDFKNQISGFSYLVEFSGRGREVKVQVGENELYPDKSYSIAITSYLSKDKNLEQILHGLKISSLKEEQTYVSEAIIEFAKNLKVIDYKEDKRRIVVRR